MGQVQSNKPNKQDLEKPAEKEAKDLKNEDLNSSTEDLLDEIDNVLDETLGEQTAEMFVSNYVQRGGQ